MVKPESLQEAVSRLFGKEFPAPKDAPGVSHEQLFWGLMAIHDGIGMLNMNTARVEAGIEEVRSGAERADLRQDNDSRALEKVVGHCNEIGRKVDTIDTIQRKMFNRVFEDEVGHTDASPTVPSPPPELDADERTTPGHRVPDRDELGDE